MEPAWALVAAFRESVWVAAAIRGACPGGGSIHGASLGNRGCIQGASLVGGSIHGSSQPGRARCSQSASRHCGAARRVPMRRGPGCSVSLVAAVWCLAAPATLCLDSRR